MDDNIHRSGIMTGLQNLWSTSQYSDMIVRSGSEEFKVHRAIICPRSKFFAAACNGPFQEGKTSVITLQDDDTPTVRRMLEYLYTLDYDDNGEAASVANCTHGKGASENLLATGVTEEQQLSAHDPPDYRKLLNNVAVYAIADKYDISELEVLATTKFENKFPCSGLLEDLASLPAIVDAVFDTTPDTKCGLRNVVIKYCKCWNEEIINNEDSVAIVRDHGEIGLAMLRDKNGKSLAARLKQAMAREKRLIWHIDRISMAAHESRIDAPHRGLGELRAVISWAEDYSNRK